MCWVLGSLQKFSTYSPYYICMNMLLHVVQNIVRIYTYIKTFDGVHNLFLRSTLTFPLNKMLNVLQLAISVILTLSKHVSYFQPTLYKNS